MDRGRVLSRVWRLRCPRCGEGTIFARAFRMRPACPVCGLAFEREPGYFIGAIYINYGLTVTLALAGYFALDWWRGWPATWQLAVWCPFVVVFPLWAFHYSRALWLALDQFVDPRERRPDGNP